LVSCCASPPEAEMRKSWLVPRHSDMKTRPLPSGSQVAPWAVWSSPAVASRDSPLARSSTMMRLRSASKPARSMEW
jgi:hypothetical protein